MIDSSRIYSDNNKHAVMITGSDGGGGAGKGTWQQAAYHVATTIATPAAYAALPWAVASLGWPLGPKGYWFITTFQQVASLGNNIAIQIAAGSSLKAVYKHFYKNGTLTLQDFIIFFGVSELLLWQLPNIHSLRWFNALCTLSTVAFAGTAVGVTIYNGENINRKSVSYALHGTSATKIFKAFHALGTISFSFGDAMLPEIQNTVREPAKKNMYKGVSAAYGVIVVSYWLLAFSGYWAFWYQVQPYILSSLTSPDWAIVMANIFVVIQISGCYQTNIFIYGGKFTAKEIFFEYQYTDWQSSVQTCSYFSVYVSYYSDSCCNAFLWGFCICMWSSGVYAARFRLPSFSFLEIWETSCDYKTAAVSADTKHDHCCLLLRSCDFGLHRCSEVYSTGCKDIQILP